MPKRKPETMIKALLKNPQKPATRKQLAEALQHMLDIREQMTQLSVGGSSDRVALDVINGYYK